MNIEQMWETFKKAIIIKEATLETVGKKNKQHKAWMTKETWEKIENRRKIKQNILPNRNIDETTKLEKTYREVDKDIKRSARNDKRRKIEVLTQKADEAANRNDSKTYTIT